MTEGARPPTRDQIAWVIAEAIADHVNYAAPFPPGDSHRAIADKLLAKFSIVARGDTPPAPTCAHEWKVDLSFPVLAVNPPVYTYRCARCDALADSIYLAPRGVTSDPQTAADAFEKWWDGLTIHDSVSVRKNLREGFSAGWNARAAVGDSPPTPADAETGD